MSDLSSVVQTAIRQVNKQQTQLGKQFITNSKYPVMSRRDRREVESYVEQLDQLNAQKNDLEQASIVAQRIGQVLEKTRKDLTAILAFANDYDFSLNDEGCCDEDGCASGQDVNINLNRIADWEKELKSLVLDLKNYVESQYLGNFSICHKNTTNLGCCVYYKCVFKYMQHVTHCYTVQDNTFVVTNPNLRIDALYALVSESLNVGGDLDACGGLDVDLCPADGVLASDPTEIIKAVAAKLDEVMEWQENNDNECTTLEYVSEVCEQNTVFYTNLVQKLTGIDDSEVKVKLQVGDKMVHELREFEKSTYNMSNYYDVRDIVRNVYNF